MVSVAPGIVDQTALLSSVQTLAGSVVPLASVGAFLPDSTRQVPHAPHPLYPTYHKHLD